MKRQSILVLVMVGLFAAVTQGVVLFESAPLGATGLVKWWGISVGDGLANPLGDSYYGWFFHVGEMGWSLSHVGGHFLRGQSSAGSLFAAIVEVDDSSTFPPDPPLEPTDVFAFTTFVPPYPSEDYRTPLSAILPPGDYALVFGSNDLGASGGYMILPHEPDIPNPSAQYPFYAYTLQGWEYDGGAYARGYRAVIEGTVIPEPCTFLLLGLGVVMLRRKKQ